VSTTWKSRILELLAISPGLTDREITDRLVGPNRGMKYIPRNPAFAKLNARRSRQELTRV
jgi:hypothetical protein